MIWFDEFTTPIGKLTIAADEVGLRHVRFQSERHPIARGPDWKRDGGALREAREQLLAYFASDRREFELPLRPVGTADRKSVV